MSYVLCGTCGGYLDIEARVFTAGAIHTLRCPAEPGSVEHLRFPDGECAMMNDLVQKLVES